MEPNEIGYPTIFDCLTLKDRTDRLSRNICKQLRTCCVTALKREGLQLIYPWIEGKITSPRIRDGIAQNRCFGCWWVCNATYVILRRIWFCILRCIRPTRSSMCLLPTIITMVIQNMLHDTYNIRIQTNSSDNRNVSWLCARSSKCHSQMAIATRFSFFNMFKQNPDFRFSGKLGK